MTDTSKPRNPLFTGSVTLLNYSPTPRPLWRRVAWYLRHPITTVRIFSGR